VDNTQKNNPLAGYYRQPGAYISLPSGGRYYEKGIKLSDDGELAIYPMTAKDELILKNPDALYNGEAVKRVLASVVPDIEDINEIPSADVDMILVAMRMASYGDEIKLDVLHEECEKRPESGDATQTIGVSLGSVIATLKTIPENVGVVHLANGLIVHLRPYDLRDQTRLLKEQFLSMRTINNVEDNETMSIQQKTEIANQQYEAMVNLTNELLCNCVTKVIIPGVPGSAEDENGVEEQQITDRKHIYNWMQNLDRASVKKLEDEIAKFAEFGIIREIEHTCRDCKQKFKTDMLFDPTAFFIAGS
jgi:hypothetical protein